MYIWYCCMWHGQKFPLKMCDECTLDNNHSHFQAAIPKYLIILKALSNDPFSSLMQSIYVPRILSLLSTISNDVDLRFAFLIPLIIYWWAYFFFFFFMANGNSIELWYREKKMAKKNRASTLWDDVNDIWKHIQCALEALAPFRFQRIHNHELQFVLQKGGWMNSQFMLSARHFHCADSVTETYTPTSPNRFMILYNKDSTYCIVAERGCRIRHSAQFHTFRYGSSCALLFFPFFVCTWLDDSWMIHIEFTAHIHSS